MDRDALEQLIDEARGLAMLICPMAFQLEDGAEIDRMPDDLFRAANMLGRLCDELLAVSGKPEWPAEHGQFGVGA